MYHPLINNSQPKEDYQNDIRQQICNLIPIPKNTGIVKHTDLSNMHADVQ